MGQFIHEVQGTGPFGQKDVPLLTPHMHLSAVALCAPGDVPTLTLPPGGPRLRRLIAHAQGHDLPRGQGGRHGVFIDAPQPTALAGTKRLKSIPVREGVDPNGIGTVIVGRIGTGHGRGNGALKRDRVRPQHVGLFALNQGRVELGMGKRVGGQDTAQELHIGGQPDDVGLGQGRIESCQGLFSIGAMHDQLGDHRVVIGADLVAFAHPIVKAHRRHFKRRRGRLAIHMQSSG